LRQAIKLLAHFVLDGSQAGQAGWVADGRGLGPVVLKPRHGPFHVVEHRDAHVRAAGQRIEHEVAPAQRGRRTLAAREPASGRLPTP
nr:hypothetical protein [Tanacetum cinerariifolium]